ncbi:hypothetical protein K503DRAFT_352612 [Rhizopogon vinicolor AM-OR11-026]|uniref:Uncharacterized protein n=1 Tax=Rhizopogon vinicolor AM-OR11-026 TaxID=1314800 RepID=A0A1B7MST8_9AGAM|nr:hypothetical protein K503DRAFT_352612 [Rhizopogon vinicolor AM-OR11-026]
MRLMSVLSHTRSSSLGLREATCHCTRHMNVILLSLATEISRLFIVFLEPPSSCHTVFCHTCLLSYLSLQQTCSMSKTPTNPWNPGT